jgi:hypothetical protein
MAEATFESRAGEPSRVPAPSCEVTFEDAGATFKGTFENAARYLQRCPRKPAKVPGAVLTRTCEHPARRPLSALEAAPAEWERTADGVCLLGDNRRLPGRAGQYEPEDGERCTASLEEDA